MCYFNRFVIIKMLLLSVFFIGGLNNMNLHEQCLLRYLKNPDELSYSTEILKLNNFILEKRFIVKNFVAKSSNITYTDNIDLG